MEREAPATCSCAPGVQPGAVISLELSLEAVCPPPLPPHMKFCFSLIGFCRGHGTHYETILLFPMTLERTLLPSLGKHSTGPIAKLFTNPSHLMLLVDLGVLLYLFIIFEN